MPFNAGTIETRETRPMEKPTGNNLGTMAIDQYGETYHMGNSPPRKWLLDHFGRQHCSKMYVDRLSGETRHVGYIIAGHWLEVFSVCAWKA